MTKRQRTLEMIRTEVAQHGNVTREALRAYIEGRVSRAAFDEAAAKGLAMWLANRRAGKSPHERSN